MGAAKEEFLAEVQRLVFEGADGERDEQVSGKTEV